MRTQEEGSRSDVNIITMPISSQNRQISPNTQTHSSRQIQNHQSILQRRLNNNTNGSANLLSQRKKQRNHPKAIIFKINSTRKMPNPQRNSLKQKQKLHQHKFIPSGAYKTLWKPAYQYKGQGQVKQVKKIKRNSTGRVMTLPPNITTNSMETIERELFVFKTLEEKLITPQNRISQNIRSVLARIRVQHESPFKTGRFSNRSFNKDSSVYGSQLNRQKSDIQKSQHKQKNNSTLTHEYPFSPAKTTYGKPLNPYPKYFSPSVKPELPSKLRQKKDLPSRQVWKPSSGSSIYYPSTKYLRVLQKQKQ